MHKQIDRKNHPIEEPHPIAANVGQRELVLRVAPMPADCNANGNIFGGWLMGQVDMAGGILAFRAATGKMVSTIAVNNLIFKHPVFVGDLLTFYATIIKIGNTSITVEVSAYAWNRKSLGTEAHQVIHATLTYVAVDEAGNPISVLDRNESA